MTKERAESAREFESIKSFSSSKKNKDLNEDDFGLYIKKHAQLWSMLAVNLGLDENYCRDIAVKTAFSLVGWSGDEDGGMSPEMFHKFRMEYIEDPRGSLEFFQRTVFQVFDKDNNGKLDLEELDSFVDVFYSCDSIFAGDSRLPKDKKDLVKIIAEKFDTNNDSFLDFDEIRIVIAGKANLSINKDNVNIDIDQV